MPQAGSLNQCPTCLLGAYIADAGDLLQHSAPGLRAHIVQQQRGQRRHEAAVSSVGLILPPVTCEAGQYLFCQIRVQLVELHMMAQLSHYTTGFVGLLLVVGEEGCRAAKNISPQQNSCTQRERQREAQTQGEGHLCYQHEGSCRQQLPAWNEEGRIDERPRLR